METTKTSGGLVLKRGKFSNSRRQILSLCAVSKIGEMAHVREPEVGNMDIERLRKCATQVGADDI